MSDVIIYSKAKEDGFCIQCVRTKAFMQQHKIDFTEVEVKSEKDKEKIRSWGFMQFPVTHIQSTGVKISGFDIVALRENIKGMK